MSLNIRKRLSKLLNKFFAKFSEESFKVIKLANKYLLNEKRDNLISNFQDVGYGFRLEGEDWYISFPGHVIIGNNVRMGGGIYFETEGGLIIGDNSYISSGVTITTISSQQNVNNGGVNTKKPVEIGKNVWIGTNVAINAGVSIGDNARIGMGAVVTRDVKENESLNMPHKQQKKREYSFSVSTNSFFPNYFEIDSEKIYFVLGTGRCGSKSIARNLDKHSGICAYHENIKQLIRISTEYAHGQKNRREVLDEIIRIFKAKTIDDSGLKALVHSDQRLWNLAGIIGEIFPYARFIHLIRDGRDTVRSMYARDWFSDNDLAYNENFRNDPWAEFRLNGYLAGDVNKNVWENWHSFERCCWYWSYINSSIAEQLNRKDDSYLLKLENINESYPKLLNYMKVKEKEIDIERYNRANKKSRKKYGFEWDAKKEELFQEIAGDTQSAFYS